MPFMIIDKLKATVMMFEAVGISKVLRFTLLGLALKDDSVLGNGHGKISKIKLDERSTPVVPFPRVTGPGCAQ